MLLGRTCGLCGTEFLSHTDNAVCPGCGSLKAHVNKFRRVVREDAPTIEFYEPARA